MDVDPSAYELAQSHLDSLLQARSDLQACTFLKNFRHIKSVLGEVNENILKSGVDGILMDLGMSSMQVCSGAIFFLSSIFCSPFKSLIFVMVCYCLMVLKQLSNDILLSLLKSHPLLCDFISLCIGK